MAWPSLEKFLEGGIFIEVSRVPKQINRKPQMQELDSPAVTFCARNYSYWKDTTVINGDSMVQSNCGFKNISEVLECIRSRTFSLNDTIKTAFYDLTSLKSLKVEKFWRENFGSPYLGMCHTFHATIKLKADMMKDGLIFQLDPELSYKIYIHDPKYYLMAANPLVYPRIFRDYKAKDLYANRLEWLYISVTEQRKLNRPDQPCEEDPEYDYIACVKTAQAKEVGCRPGWEDWSDKTIPLCTTEEERSQHEILDWKTFNGEQKTLENRTGCMTPCRFKEYSIVGVPIASTADIIGSVAKKLSHFIVSSKLNFLNLELLLLDSILQAVMSSLSKRLGYIHYSHLLQSLEGLLDSFLECLFFQLGK